MTPQPSPAYEAVDYEKLLVHNWRVARLTGPSWNAAPTTSSPICRT